MILGDNSHYKHILKMNSVKVEVSVDVLLLGITIDIHDRVHKSMSQLNPEFIWFYFTHKDMPYSLRKGVV